MEKNFVDGVSFKEPRENAPEWIRGQIAVNVARFLQWLAAQEHNGWINIDVKQSKGGKLYCERNTYEKLGMTEKPDGLTRTDTDYRTHEEPVEDINPDDIPF